MTALLLSGPIYAQAEDALADLRIAYQRQLGSIVTDEMKLGASAREAYAAWLQRVQGDLTRAGDLDGLLAVKAEAERLARDGHVPAESDPALGPMVERGRTAYRKALEGGKAETSRRVVVLHEAYAKRLSDLVAAYTRAGRIDDALTTREEMSRADASRVYTDAQQVLAEASTIEQAAVEEPAVDMTEPQAWWAGETREDGFLFGWGAQRGDQVVFGYEPNGGGELEFEGDAKRSREGLHLSGGRVLVDAVNEGLLAACRASNELRIELKFRTSSDTQVGPARILSFSSGAQSRNFTIGQQNDRIVLRLRTSKSDLNGMRPEVELCRVRPKRDYHLAVSYSDGQLEARLNGRRLELEETPQGDFSNWRPQHFLLGNEHGTGRPWRGTIHSVWVWNRAGFPAR